MRRTTVKAVERGDQGAGSDAAPLRAIFLFELSYCRRVLDLEPMSRSAGPVRRAKAIG